MSAKRYVYQEYLPNPSFSSHGVLDIKTGKSAATLETKAGAEICVRLMNEADARAHKDVAPYVEVIEGLAKILLGMMPEIKKSIVPVPDVGGKS